MRCLLKRKPITAKNVAGVCTKGMAFTAMSVLEVVVGAHMTITPKIVKTKGGTLMDELKIVINGLKTDMNNLRVIIEDLEERIEILEGDVE